MLTVEVWKLVIDTAYADNIEANPRPFYQEPLPFNGGGDNLFASYDKIKKRTGYIPNLKKALELALAERDKLEDNPFYQRDIIDIGTDNWKFFPVRYLL